MADLLAIIDDISDDNPGAAQSLKDEIHDKAARLRDHPRSIALVVSPARARCLCVRITSWSTLKPGKS
ncbi:type II toxin-antitoxin system RelE/ParE family toxin [Salipiger abyssi]|uniref:type II toxin-antitoxin system RelE/ParE family toxin n=1 Tax=Salipiger abyssi TaxID=1250539 RepID=UPI002E280EA2|nr:type II toxin-antitoxin system RelE/ParE family toxin [Salipiger abyssi]